MSGIILKQSLKKRNNNVKKTNNCVDEFLHLEFGSVKNAAKTLL